MRLIDADELIKQIQITYCKDCKDCNKNKEFFHCCIEQIIGDIYYAPTINEYHFIMKGYEQGFNDKRQEAIRAERWHYPSKGEYPKENEPVCALVYGFDKPMIVRWYKDDNEDLCWQDCWDYCLYKADEIRCWQYIVPPQEEINETNKI